MYVYVSLHNSVQHSTASRRRVDPCMFSGKGTQSTAGKADAAPVAVLHTPLSTGSALKMQ